VDIGQTVAASFQAPKLFVIAPGSTADAVETDVDEADIGRVQREPGGHLYCGRLRRPRVPRPGAADPPRRARVVQNVVTYTVLVSADNSDLRLLPG